ncbi:Myosin-X [Chelonia mydas]|uniref:Myosin-X n=1 Tax=Chelonia mydas TaxID=8469 RepID=M7AV10_CHEMY|nr:Myosin-X [Chelonia mydas]
MSARCLVFTYKQSTITHQKVTAMHQTSVESVEDMAALVDLHEGSIMHNLFQRYQQNKIYKRCSSVFGPPEQAVALEQLAWVLLAVLAPQRLLTYIGSIVASVNPYKTIPGLYDRTAVEQYSKHHMGEIPPHIFAVANECYRCLWKRHDNQCVLISGESGAGKTESTKLILKFLSAMSQHSLELSRKEKTSCVEQAILESSPIMEAFGNAKTVYNNNSSRFGKFVQLNICQKGNIQGGRIVDYLLEKNRVVRQNPGERNYHIFYALLAGIEEEEKDAFYLSVPEHYHYLNQSGCVADKTINDKDSFKEVITAMEVMQFSKEDVREVLRLLAGILHLGNIEFITAGGAQVSFKTALSTSAELLGLDSTQLTEALTQRSMILRGEEILTPLSVQQAVDSRDSVAMALYSQCFAWVIKKINSRIRGKEDFKSIGILDIFGFENFEVNRFEQFNINYANEKLQEYFNKHIFSLEQLEYSREGLVWKDIDWTDNGECLDLIEKNNSFYVKPRVAVHNFGVKHYAGEVQYDVRGILEKNRDTFRDDLLNLLRESRLDFIYDLFEHVSSRNNQDTLKCGSKHRKPTVSLQFKDSLHSLMATLSSSNPFFVRCIKPNMQKGQPAPTPKNKDSRRLDSFGRKIHSSLSFQLGVANHQALLGRYGFNLWGSLPKFEDSLQECGRKEFKSLVEEVTAAARPTLLAVSDVADTAMWSMASAVSMRRASWLLLSGLSSEAQISLQDLPFDGKAVFAEQTDIKLHGLKDSHTMLQTLGLYVPAPAKPKFKSQQAPA